VSGEDDVRGDRPDSSARAPHEPHHPFDATAPGPACFQSTPAIGAPLSPAVALSEDCLTLSVFTPGLRVNVNVNPPTPSTASAASTAAGTAAGTANTSTSSQALGLPVIVWIHGGSYTGGGSYEVRRNDRMRVPYTVCVCVCCARCAGDCWCHSL
jgi:carboxylesterase type B